MLLLNITSFHTHMHVGEGHCMSLSVIHVNRRGGETARHCHTGEPNQAGDSFRAASLVGSEGGT
jgi:hypothetical protein